MPEELTQINSEGLREFHPILPLGTSRKARETVFLNLFKGIGELQDSKQGQDQEKKEIKRFKVGPSIHQKKPSAGKKANHST